MSGSKEREKGPVTRGNIVDFLDYSKITDDFNGDTIGLVPVVVQDVNTKKVLMVAFANAAAVQKSLDTGMATFWTRSRQKLWTKGEESGNFMRVVRMDTDCDGDTVLLQVEPQGDRCACHTGAKTCFYRGFECI